MISLGRRDARKELALGFVGGGGAVGGEMEDTELEEGEACSYHDNNDGDFDDASMDPDALSYIDEKLQDVLGHFQKDFEGGVSAENLGAKFGGYGSFLPAYQRSPVWSHSRAPPVQHHNAPRSPNNFQLEGGRRSSVSSSTARQSGGVEVPSTSAVLMNVSKSSSSLIDSVKQEICLPSTHFTEELAPKHKSLNRESDNLSDQKMLKVRIKVGSDNLSTRKNAAIYSGLGLDVSPSSSLDDSPSESDGISHEPQDALFESPAHILQMMTSFPMHGGFLLSPLSDDLIHFMPNEKLSRDSRSFAGIRVGPESSGIAINGSDSLKNDGKSLGEKKMKPLERNLFSIELKSEMNKDARSDIDVTPKKEIDLDSSACEELVSNTLKLPLLSNSYSAAGEMAKGSGKAANISKEAYKGMVKGEVFSDLKKEESFVPIVMREDGLIENSKATSAGKVGEYKQGGSLDSVSVNSRKDGHGKGEKLHELVKIDSKISKGRKAPNAELIDGPKHKADLTTTPVEQEGMELLPTKERSSFEGKKKLKRSQNHGNVASDITKESLRVGSSSMSKNKKSSYSDNNMRYRDFFGDIELEQEENRRSPLEMSYGDKIKDSDVVEKGAPHNNSVFKEKSSGKKSEKAPASESFPKPAAIVAPPGGNDFVPVAGPATTVPVIQDLWVCCDKCQKWRLLPHGKNPNDLPEKWICSMLNWLPGMNRCNISEEETTNALRALYQVLPPESQNSLQADAGGHASKLAQVQHTDQSHQNLVLPAMPTGGKKNSMKKSIHASVTNGSLNGVNKSPMVSETDFLKPSKSSDLAMEKNKNKQKEKHKVLDNCSDGGDTKRSKNKGKRESNQDCFRASKKIRDEGLAEDWMSDHGAIEKVGPSLSNGLPTMYPEKNLPKYNDCTSSQDSKHGRKDRVEVSAKRPKHGAQVSSGDQSMDLWKCDDRDVSKRRKLKESHGLEIYPSSISNTEHHLQDSRFLSKEEFCGNDYKRDKKARVSRSDGKDSSASKGNSRLDRKGSHKKNHQLGKELGSTVSHRSLDGVDSLKRDSVSLHPYRAATSSSSKVSGSHKAKTNFHDSKGSPVESVSSSPMRVSKPDKLTLLKRNVVEKDDSIDAGCLAMGGMKRCSDGEDDDGSERSGTLRKEKNVAVAHHESLESSVLDFQDKDFNHVSSGGDKIQIMTSPEATHNHFTNGGADYSDQDTRYPSISETLDRCRNDERHSENHYDVNGSRPRKSGKVSSSRPKDKNRKFNSEFDNGIAKASGSVNEQAPSCGTKPVDGINKTDGQFRSKSDEDKDKYANGKDSAGLSSINSNIKERQSNLVGHSNVDVKCDPICSRNAISTPKHILQPDCETVSGRVKSPALPPSGGAQDETMAHCHQAVSGSHKGSGQSMGVNDCDGDLASKALKQSRKVDHPNGIHHDNSSDPMPPGHRVRDLDASSPIKRESSSQAANAAVKEATNLKHMADRLKNSGLTLESTRLYFESVVKFLHGAFLLESCSTGDSMKMYSSTARLCEFCANEFERSKDMAAAALAYKCMEVAYMKVIYFSHTSANRDREELQRALQGESPSSSVSDVDNLNHPATVDKVHSAKGMSSPQVTGGHVIAAQYRPNFTRLLNYAKEVNYAMEASKKSRIAFGVANASLGEGQCRDGISSIKSVLDFGFRDIQEFLRLVKVAVKDSGY